MQVRAVRLSGCLWDSFYRICDRPVQRGSERAASERATERAAPRNGVAGHNNATDRPTERATASEGGREGAAVGARNEITGPCRPTETTTTAPPTADPPPGRRLRSRAHRRRSAICAAREATALPNLADVACAVAHLVARPLPNPLPILPARGAPDDMYTRIGHGSYSTTTGDPHPHRIPPAHPGRRWATWAHAIRTAVLIRADLHLCGDVCTQCQVWGSPQRETLRNRSETVAADYSQPTRVSEPGVHVYVLGRMVGRGTPVRPGAAVTGDRLATVAVDAAMVRRLVAPWLGTMRARLAMPR